MILVTGIIGHTGSYFIEEMMKNNYKEKIRCIVLKDTSIELLEKSGLDYEVVIGDLSDLDTVYKACEDVDTIVHIASINLSPNIIDAALKANLKRAILVHTTGVYSKFKMASEGYKKIDEEVLAKAEGKIDLTIIRPTMIYGNICDRNMVKFITMIDKMKIYPMIAGGRAQIQPVNARDLGKAYYQILVNPEATKNKEYNLSGEKTISIKDLLKMIGKNLNKKTIFLTIPIWLSVTCAYILRIISIGKIDMVEKVLRMDESRCFSHENATKDFGYNPMSLEEGIKTEVEQYLELKKLKK